MSDTETRIPIHYQHIEVPKNVPHGCSTNIKCERNVRPGFQQTVSQVGGNRKRTGNSLGKGDSSESGSLDKEGYLIPMQSLKGITKDLDEYHEYDYPDARSTQDRSNHSATYCDDHNPSTTSPDIQIHHHYHQGEDLPGYGSKEAHDRDYLVYVVPNADSGNLREDTDGYHGYDYPDTQFSSKTADSHVYESRLQKVDISATSGPFT